ncbi:hypothetical protein DSO57_1004125 [Entomophthora muscae]|uniref:Uncharacterized protein n=3 Tax=Entomophthora muscae TaxID=34485 RepID=A0ACC2TJE6_9FUNG|nr:hypothetical protein DSO57_1004125 [Entomophthora muscae]
MNSTHLADRVDADDSDALDQLFEELESEDLDRYREQRLDEMKRQAAELLVMKDTNHGTYLEVEEKDVLGITTNTPYAIVHFFHPGFERCKIMDGHLEKLAQKHFRVRFVKANAELCPFLVTKLKIKVLPFVIAFVKGVVVERLVGFEQLGNIDDFKISRLENILYNSGVIRDPKLSLITSNSNQEGARKIRSNTKAYGSDEE